MKNLIYTLILIPSLTLANSEEFMLSGITTHIFGNSKEVASLYKNKLNDRGIIANPLVGVRLNLDDRIYTVFSGVNSVGLPMAGLLYGRQVEDYRYANISWHVGGYFQNGNDFPEATKTCKDGKCYALGRQSNFMPVVGFNVKFYLYRSSTLSILQNNLLTPIITNHGISISMSLK